MTANQVQIRRDTAGNLASNTPASGELGYDTTNKRIVAGDGTTAGGIPHVNFTDHINNTFVYAAAGGTANAITIALTKAPASYGTPFRVIFKATNTNTGATTVNVNSLGIKNIQKFSGGSLGALAAGDIVSGGIYEIAYDGTQFQLLTLQNAGITSVSQGDLNTSSGTFSTSLSAAASGTSWVAGAPVALPGGQFGFMIESSVNSADFGAGKVGGWIPSRNSTSYGAYVAAVNYGNTNTRTIQGQQTYITSSPPFDLGDGDAHGFIFALVNSLGEIHSHYAADVPPWAYNGPTNIKAA